MNIKREISDKLKIVSLISIILVIYIHSYNLKSSDGSILFSLDTSFSYLNSFIQNIISQGFSRISVPIFFMISGYLFFTNFNILSYKSKVLKRVYTLLIPYLSWSMIVVLIFFILQAIPFASSFFNSMLIKDLSLNELFYKTWIDPINYPLWFLRDLIVLVVLSPIIFYFIKNFKSLFFLIIGFIWLFGIEIPLYKSESVLFFAIGGYLSIVNEKLLLIKLSNKIFLLLIIAYVLLLSYSAIINILKIDINLSMSDIIHKISILIGVITLWYLLDRINIKTQIILYISDFTFLFYVFHEPLLTIIKKSMFFLFGFSSVISLVTYLLTPIIVVFCLFIFGKVIKKNLPKTTAVITGNRI
ncbi:acyltransferase [Sulfurimonas sp.]|uniref:acyltransferase n=1 Tax=Sulfurimonas sp. TaxID=2022749 RepID=UPI002B46AE95|nr:acyltransferase [Sulfurimonas sp.]